MCLAHQKPKANTLGGQNETTELLGTCNSLLSSNPVSATVTGQEDSALQTHRALRKAICACSALGTLLRFNRQLAGILKDRLLLEPTAVKLWACEHPTTGPPSPAQSISGNREGGLISQHSKCMCTRVKVSVHGGCVRGCIRSSECAGQVCGDAESAERASHRVTGPGHSQSLCRGLISSHLAGMPTCISEQNVLSKHSPEKH